MAALTAPTTISASGFATIQFESEDYPGEAVTVRITGPWNEINAAEKLRQKQRVRAYLEAAIASLEAINHP